MRIQVRVAGTGRVLLGSPGDDILEVFQSHGEPLATACGGVASCGLCRVAVLAGGESRTPLKPQEIVHLGALARSLGLRLACQARIRAVGDAEILVHVPEKPEELSTPEGIFEGPNEEASTSMKGVAKART